MSPNDAAVISNATGIMSGMSKVEMITSTATEAAYVAALRKSLQTTQVYKSVGDEYKVRE